MCYISVITLIEFDGVREERGERLEKRDEHMGPRVFFG